MTQEEKDLLLQDLSARLPYGVILNCCNTIGEKLTCIDENGLINHDYDINECKPYLFPLSSMDEKQLEELGIERDKDLFLLAQGLKRIGEGDKSIRGRIITYNAVNWCNKHHFDYRGLIPMGLANDATRLNIY